MKGVTLTNFVFNQCLCISVSVCFILVYDMGCFCTFDFRKVF